MWTWEIQQTWSSTSPIARFEGQSINRVSSFGGESYYEFAAWSQIQGISFQPGFSKLLDKSEKRTDFCTKGEDRSFYWKLFFFLCGRIFQRSRRATWEKWSTRTKGKDQNLNEDPIRQSRSLGTIEVGSVGLKNMRTCKNPPRYCNKWKNSYCVHGSAWYDTYLLTTKPIGSYA